MEDFSTLIKQFRHPSATVVESRRSKEHSHLFDTHTQCSFINGILVA